MAIGNTDSIYKASTLAMLTVQWEMGTGRSGVKLVQQVVMRFRVEKEGGVPRALPDQGLWLQFIGLLSLFCRVMLLALWFYFPWCKVCGVNSTQKLLNGRFQRDQNCYF